MAVTVYFSKEFRKQLQKMPAPMRQKFSGRLELFLADPFHPTLANHPLRGEYAGCRSINITGDMRAILTMQGHTAVFLAIGTHHELYGR